MANLPLIVEALSSLTTLEASDLVRALETKWGVSGKAAPRPALIPDSPEAIEVQTQFSAVLTSFGANKIGVIKEVRGVTKLGLSEAKALVESAPATIKNDITKEEAFDIKTKIEAVGGSVTVS